MAAIDPVNRLQRSAFIAGDEGWGFRLTKTFSISLLLTLASWSAASACSPVSEVMTGEQFYSSINPSKWSSWDLSEYSVGMVFVQELKRKKRTVEVGYHPREKQKKPFIKVRYSLVEKLTPNYQPREKEWLPQLRQEWADTEREIQMQPRSFAFWDLADLSSAVEYDFGAGWTSCGPSPTQTLLPNSHYLHFQNANGINHWEILSGPDDELVDDFKDVLSNQKLHQARRAAESYFRDMSGYAELEIKKCPTDKEIYSRQSWGGYPNEEDSAEFFTVNSSYQSNVDSLRIIDVQPYLNYIGEADWTCVPGFKFLVLDQLSQNRERNRNDFQVTPVRHRYLPIKNNTVQRSDILSKIEIVGPEIIHIDDIKSWIETSSFR